MTNQKQILWKENVKYELVYEWLNRDVSLGRNLRLMHAVLLRRAEPCSQLPFLLCYLSTMYHNSR